MHVISYTAISEVQIVGLCRIFSRQGINLFHYRKDTRALTMIADIEDTVFHITFVADGTGNLEIGEALHFRFTKQIVRQVGNLFVIVSPTMQFFGSLHNIH